MNWVFISLLVLTVGQTWVCGFSLSLLLAYIGRLLFLLRRIGSIVPCKVSIGFEMAHMFFVVLGIVFTKGSIDWLGTLWALLFCLAICILYFIDDTFYLYVVTDENDHEEES